MTSEATEVCLVDVHYYIRSRDNSKVVFSRRATDNSKVATEVCLVDVH